MLQSTTTDKGRPRRVLLVAHRATETNERLAAAFERHGLPCEIRSPGALAAARRDDLVLTRLDVRRTLDGVEPGLEEVALAAGRGLRVLNPPAAMIAAHDKLVTAQRLRQAGLPHPWTTHVFGKTPPLVPLPVVVKPRFGSWGAGVHRCLTAGEMEARFRSLDRRGWARREGILVQELVAGDAVDLRVVVAAGRVVGAARRVGAPGEWRTNVSLGGRRLPACVEPEAAALAIRSAAAGGGDLVGVDLLPRAEGGWCVVEVNAAVDFTPDYSLDGRDPFAEAVDALVGATAAVLPVPRVAFSFLSG